MSTIVFEGERFEDTEEGRRMAAEEVIRAGYYDEDFEEYVDDHVSAYELLTDMIYDAWSAERVLGDLREQFIEAMTGDSTFIDMAVHDFCEVEE